MLPGRTCLNQARHLNSAKPRAPPGSDGASPYLPLASLYALEQSSSSFSFSIRSGLSIASFIPR
jgi:hypothetical protein